MTYSYENITLNVSNLNDINFTGDTELTLQSNFVAELIENACTFSRFFLEFQMEDLYYELEQDEDLIINHFKNLNEEIIVTNADAIIAVYEYCLNEDKEFIFDVETENVSWVIHDILHAVHDAAGCTIYVESEIEKERIIKSLEITKEQFPNELPDFMFLEDLERQFYERFKTHLNLDDFKEFEEDYY